MTKITNAIVTYGNANWLVREAVTLEAAEDAIAMARCTGSVGSRRVESRGDVETVTADVVRLDADNRECLGGGEKGADHSALVELFSLRAQAAELAQLRTQHADICRAYRESGERALIMRGALDGIEALVTGELPIHHDGAFLRSEAALIVGEVRTRIEAARVAAQAGA